MEEKEIFMTVLEHFRGKYPHRNIGMVKNCVAIDNELKFNTEGYNLLYNLQRLVKALEDELL